MRRRSDDPTGTLTGSDRVGGNLVGARALGLVVHASTVVGNLTESGGGGGPSCAPPPTGYFAQIGNPVYSDVEDDTVGGNLRVVRLQTCWLGLLRDTVQGNLTDRANTFTDPDANEALANTVRGNLACSGNTPAVHYGDSGGLPNLVHGRVSGECSFTASTSQPIAVKS